MIQIYMKLPEGKTRLDLVREGVAAGLKKLTEMSDSDRTAIGGRGHALVATKFSWPRIGEQMRSVYDWVLGGGATPESVNLMA